MDAIKRLAQTVWKYKANNPNRVKCPKCGGCVWPASGVIGAEFTISEFAARDGGKVISGGALRCKDCSHVFTEGGDA